MNDDSERLPPACEHWVFGNIVVQEQHGLVTYERAVLLSFRTVEEFREAMRYVELMLQGPPA